MPLAAEGTAQPERILVLDGYRGISILMVTLYRFAYVVCTPEVVGKWPAKVVLLGAAGVDFFFVLSGFLITGILLDSKDSTGYFRRFYTNRSLRIFPLYFATLAVFFLLLPLIPVGAKLLADVEGNQLALWTYMTNLAIAWNNHWSFGSLNHFWSLAIEEQFYLLWPCLVWMTNSRRLMHICIVSLVLFAAARIGGSWVGIGAATEKTLTLFRLDGLLLGSMAAVALRDGLLDRVSSKSMHIGLLLSATLYGISLTAGAHDLTIRYTLVSLMAAALLLVVYRAPSESLITRLFENRLLRVFGKYSYAMYIFQGPMIPIAAYFLNSANVTEQASHPILAAILYTLGMFAATYFFAWLSWNLFEKHFLALKSKHVGHQQIATSEQLLATADRSS